MIEKIKDILNFPNIEIREKLNELIDAVNALEKHENKILPIIKKKGE